MDWTVNQETWILGMGLTWFYCDLNYDIIKTVLLSFCLFIIERYGIDDFKVPFSWSLFLIKKIIGERKCPWMVIFFPVNLKNEAVYFGKSNSYTAFYGNVIFLSPNYNLFLKDKIKQKLKMVSMCSFTRFSFFNAYNCIAVSIF